MLDHPDKKGETLRKRLKKFEEQGEPRDPRLDSVDIPPGGDFLFDFYWDIRCRMTCEDNLSYQELEACCRLKGIALAPREVTALMEMDLGYRVGVYEAGKAVR
ncbi:MAG: DUF4265 domain-containing protein [Deltaproteobacteria bacterium]|nr:DUF4265 domain-containing protein [Deltaproteobacteria bacterium]